jgi:head-tail adaptor
MSDTCHILAYSETQDVRGEVTAAYTAGSATACAFRPGSSSEAASAEMTKAAATAEVWLPLATTVTRRDRIRITKLWGDTLAAPLEYDIVGDPRRDVGRLICQLREVAP